ncbi:MAG: hypothetical protein C5B49_03345 [Bdellovibrio sp.]|nr:MAG: hypothetical protein C5B49_03345 [Bdellovibrio sp.]
MTSLTQKLAESDFQQQMIRAFADGKVCTSLFAGLTFDATNAVAGNPNQPKIYLTNSTIPISTLPSAPPLAVVNKPVSPLSPNLIVAAAKGLELANIAGTYSGGNGIYSATFNVNFDDTKLASAVAPASVQIRFSTTGTMATQTIVQCIVGTPPTDGVPCGATKEGVSQGGYCWYFFHPSCTNGCATHGGTNDDATINYAGSGGTLENCRKVLLAAGWMRTQLAYSDAGCYYYDGYINPTLAKTGAGCGVLVYVNTGPGTAPWSQAIRCTDPATNMDAFPGGQGAPTWRACACNN